MRWRWWCIILGLTMNSRMRRFSRQYAATLGRCLARQQEALLEQAYDLGRKAIAQGLGVLDVARIHQRALGSCLLPALSPEKKLRTLTAAENFFMEMLSPFEVTHRGFRQANLRLHQLNEALEQRNVELAAMNRELTQEIAERRRVERALRESEERYSMLIETASDLIFYLTTDGRIAAVNRAFEVITGWPRAAWLGKPFAPLLHPDDARIAVERFRAIVRGRPPERWEYRVRKRTGEYAVGEFTLAQEIKAGRCTGIFGIARDITQRKRTEEELRQSREHYRTLFDQACVMQENLRHLSNQILHVQEQERKRISRELHDEVGQALTAINTNLAMLQRNGAVETNLLKQKIADTQGLLGQTMDTVHRFARELRPAMLDELGLLPALRSYMKAFAERTGLEVRFAASADAEHLDDEQKTVLFRVTQESLTNVAKHARATQVSVTLRKLKNEVQMQVRDNGKAFKVDQQPVANGKKRLGLLGMQERVRLVNGHFAVKSAPGKGTTVSVGIPLKPGSLLAVPKSF